MLGLKDDLTGEQLAAYATNQTMQIRLNYIRKKCAQGWQDNQTGAILPIWQDTDFENAFKNLVNSHLRKIHFGAYGMMQKHFYKTLRGNKYGR